MPDSLIFSLAIAMAGLLGAALSLSNSSDAIAGHLLLVLLTAGAVLVVVWTVVLAAIIGVAMR